MNGPGTPDEVKLVNRSIKGEMVQDQICLDNNQDTCLDDFEFLLIKDTDFPKDDDYEKFGGVISFN